MSAILTMRATGRHVSGQMGRFVDWWITELREMVPSSVRTFLAGGEAALVLQALPGGPISVELRRGPSSKTIATIAAGTSDTRTLLAEAVKASASAKGAEVAVVLHEDEVIARTLIVPAVTEHRLRDLLTHEIERKVSLDPSEVYLGALVKGRDRTRGRMEVAMLVAERQAVAPWRDLAVSCGVRLTGIFAASGSHLVALHPISDPDMHKALRTHWRLRLTTSLVILSVCLWGAAVTIDWRRTNHELKIARAEIVRNQTAVQELSKLQHEITELQTQAIFLQKRLGKVSALEVLNEAARVLPDDTWLSSLHIAGEQVSTDGYSADAAKLVRMIESAPIFKNVRFGAPVVRAADGRGERFEVTFDLVSGTNP